MEGYKFEDRILKEFQEAEVHIKRIKSRSTGFKGDNEIADFYIYYNPTLFYIEAKSVKGKSLPFSNIQKNQAIGLWEASKVDGIVAGFLVEYREVDEVYFIEISAMNELLEKGIKSFSLDFARSGEYSMRMGFDGATDLTRLLDWQR